LCSHLPCTIPLVAVTPPTTCKPQTAKYTTSRNTVPCDDHALCATTVRGASKPHIRHSDTVRMRYLDKPVIRSGQPDTAGLPRGTRVVTSGVVIGLPEFGSQPANCSLVVGRYLCGRIGILPECLPGPHIGARDHEFEYRHWLSVSAALHNIVP
jgi:hypothetical protein